MRVDARHPAYSSAYSLWSTCRDAFGGGESVKAAGEAYLPRLGGQDDTEYDAYKSRSLFYNATARTVRGLQGLIFRRDPKVLVPDSASPLLDDITLTGVQFDSFCSTVVEELLITNRYGVLVDYPKEGQEQRPYFIGYPAESIVNWATSRVGGKTMLSRVVLMEMIEQESAEDKFEIEFVAQYRVLELEEDAYVVRVFREDKDKEWMLVEETIPRVKGSALAFIPFVFVGGNWTVKRPPLADLVDVNISHYRTSADLEHGRHYCGLPTPWVAGFPRETIVRIGSSVAWVAEDPNAKAGMLEFSGQGLGALEKALLEKQDMMATLGARLLEQQKAAAETAEAVMMRHSGEQATLGTLANEASRSLTDALSILVEWCGEPSDDVLVELNTEFFDQAMSPQQMRELTLSWQAGGISHETYYWNLQRGQITRPGVEFDEESQLISKQLEASAFGGGVINANPQRQGAAATDEQGGEPAP